MVNISFQVQHEVLQKRQKEKREMLDAVKKFRKGTMICILIVQLNFVKVNFIKTNNSLRRSESSVPNRVLFS